VGAQAGAEESAGQAAFSVSATACVAARACGARAPQHMHSARLATHTTGRARRRPLTCRCHGFWCTRALAPVPASTHHVHALHHVAKHHVLAVQPLGLHGAQEDCGWVVDGGAGGGGEGGAIGAGGLGRRSSDGCTRARACTRAHACVCRSQTTPPLHTLTLRAVGVGAGVRHGQHTCVWQRGSTAVAVWDTSHAHAQLPTRTHEQCGCGSVWSACCRRRNHWRAQCNTIGSNING
jgi:hypothetical protein